MRPFQIPVLFDVLRTLSDGSMKITFVTRELAPEEGAQLLSYRKKEGWLLFKEAVFEDSDIIDIPESVPEFHNSRTPSQRLRNVLYRVWELKAPDVGFEAWRITEMERIIQHYKDKLL